MSIVALMARITVALCVRCRGRVASPFAIALQTLTTTTSTSTIATETTVFGLLLSIVMFDLFHEPSLKTLS